MAQIPALVISIAAGIIVSRVSTEEDIAGQMLSNVFSKTQALYITAAILGMMGMIPGMPNFAFLLLAGGMVWLAQKGSRQPKAAAAAPEVQTAPIAAVEVPGSQLGRRRAHRHAGAGSRLPPDSAGGQRRR